MVLYLVPHLASLKVGGLVHLMVVDLAQKWDLLRVCYLVDLMDGHSVYLMDVY